MYPHNSNPEYWVTSKELRGTNITVFGMTQLRIEPTTFKSQGWHYRQTTRPLSLLTRSNKVVHVIMHRSYDILFTTVSKTQSNNHLPCVSCTASGVDAVGEVVMCVDILPQPNGEHKINVKGRPAMWAAMTVLSSLSLLTSLTRVSPTPSGGCQRAEVEGAGLQAICGGLHHWPSSEWQEEKVCHQVQEQQLVPEVCRKLPVVSIQTLALFSLIG